MLVSWRPLLLTAIALALVLPRTAQALDQPALEEMEGLLRDLGFDPGVIDGVVDETTLEAIRQYHDFALRPGPPEPSQSLLDELRGVAAAFTALNEDKRQQVSAEAPPPETPPVPPEAAAEPQPPQQEPEPPEKVVVPPPPAPPKLLAEAPAPEPEVPAKSDAPDAGAPQVAELPPAAEAPAAEAPAAEAAPPSAADIEELEELDPAALLQQRIDEELAPYRTELQNGSLTRADLARQFNTEGRTLLQRAQYEDAILKFTVAIHLDPNFAGAYSNRGTAYQRTEAANLAKQDFDKAKTLGFGGFRLRDGSNPLN